jgi:hypothetical protein
MGNRQSLPHSHSTKPNYKHNKPPKISSLKSPSKSSLKTFTDKKLRRPALLGLPALGRSAEKIYNLFTTDFTGER